ncbi:hypothetical protein FRC09_000862 [Ceratobasidium sp. 395]|nr:hypothetical protein FRC09_000862 [Ceratobasidium sp. 395]
MNNSILAMREPTSTQTYAPVSLVILVAALILGYLRCIRPRLQPPQAVNSPAVETPRVAGLNPAVVGGHDVPTSEQHRRSSFVEHQASQEVVNEAAVASQTRHITSPRSPIAQGTQPEPTGQNDEAQSRNSQRSPTHSPASSVHANTRGSTLGVVQPVEQGRHVTDLPNTEASQETTVPAPGASAAPAVRSSVVQGVLPTASIRGEPGIWRALSSLLETEREESVFSPRSYGHKYRPRAIHQLLDPVGDYSDHTQHDINPPPSPALSPISPTRGARNSTLLKALDGWDLSRAVAPLAILAVGVNTGKADAPETHRM